MRSSLTFFILLILIFGCKENTKKQQATFYIGTMTSDVNDGIKLATLNLQTGELTNLQTVAKVQNPNFLDIDKSSNTLFSVSEEQNDSTLNYFVKVFDINKKTRSLSLRTEEKVPGVHPCYISYSSKNKKLMTANYRSGDNSFFSLADKTPVHENTIQHYGIGPDSTRQEAPHAHSIIIGPNQKHAYSADLGADKIYIFNIEEDNNIIADSIICIPGSGPRHIDFSPDQSIMAVLNELNSTIDIYKKDQNNLYKNHLQTISTLPDSFNAFSKAADIHFSKDGKFLYASNRGYNSLVIYQYDKEILKLKGWETEGINWPRNFAIDPSDQYILVANKKENNITVYKRNKKNGLLKKLNYNINVNSPVCIKFLND